MTRSAGFLFLILLLGLPPAWAETVVVLPFFNLTKARSLDWVGESVSVDVAETLAEAGWLVVDRDSREEGFRRLAVKKYVLLTYGSVMEVGMNLDADVVVWGDFEQSTPGQIRLRAYSASLKQMRKSPMVDEAGRLDQLSRLQNSLARRVRNSLDPAHPVGEPEFLRSHPAVRVDALESYVRGLLTSNYEQKYRLFAKAALLEPTYAEPAYELGKLHYGRQSYPSASQWFGKVSAVSSHYREAQFFLGLCRFRVGDFTAARDAFRIVAESVPLAEVINNLGAAQLRLNEPEAVDTLTKALEADKSDPIYHFNLGYALWKQGDFERAAGLFRATLERTPDDQTATLLLGRCLQKSGPRSGEVRTQGQERLKTNYDESAWRHLQAVLTRLPAKPE